MKRGISVTTQQIAKILEPINNKSGKSIVKSGDISKIDTNQNKITIQLSPTKEYRSIKSSIQAVLNQQKIQNVEISMSTQPIFKEENKSTEFVKHIIAVGSCKGGVGKSTTALNLAYILSQERHKVGLLDLDIYGPSLPTLISPINTTIGSYDGVYINPIEFEGVKCMSFGYINPGKTVARGPVITGIVKRLTNYIEWGELDYLVLDMPPGTGDIHLTVAQEMKISGSVIVSIPHKLSFVDVVKGIEMFDEMKIPTIAAVENMSYLQCECGIKHRIYGTSHFERLKNQYGITNTIEMPIIKDISMFSEKGVPAVIGLPRSHLVCKTYLSLAKGIVSELQKDKKAVPIFSYEKSKNAVASILDGKMYEVPCNKLRANCCCAVCISKSEISSNAHPINIMNRGNYAVQVQWSDSHISIYSYDSIIKLSLPKN